MKTFTYRIYLIIALVLLIMPFSSCVSPKKLIGQGQYDHAIASLVKKLTRNKNKDKNVELIEAAFKKANQRDLDRITFLKKEGRPENWDEIYQRYHNIKSRQDRVQAILPLYIQYKNRSADLPFVKIEDDMISSKEKAAAFYYANAMQLLTKNNRMDARRAYEELTNIKQYYTSYKDLDDQLRRAHAAGTNYVLYKFKNDYRGIIPAEFEREFMKISLQDQNDFWINYHVVRDPAVTYDYEVRYLLKDIQVSPEQYKEVQYEETKQVQDGWEYEYDRSGNVKKDSLGNDIKKPKYKTIKATVKEIQQRKMATLIGKLQYYNNHTGQMMESHPIGADAVWENFAATYMGDKNALKPDTLKKIGNSPQAFPTNEYMIMQANATIKPIIKSSVAKYHNLVAN